MSPLERDSWNSAALRLFDDKYSLVITGPRKHPDWHQDVIAVLQREVEDPRGWISLDWEIEHDQTEHGPAFPFRSITTDYLAEHLHEITVTSASHLLVTMTDDWFSVKNIPDFPDRRGELLADSRTLLSRYGATPACYTTSISARTTRDPDFFTKTSAGVEFTDFIMDLGLVVVSETEVGVFWSFNAY
ncbi:hypothetical protein SSOG_05556 [Streptomyces himastatinicus ATCC 53653]|uniref:Uncharacterized protein n=1 Tax=Streptomyces himastatinicus ATCC 53653 TaxID=457427 RepID=D9WMD9_9ACTN|nr:hypothetical protein [Streptomyces himastatinicus]EFL25842.1 hypothetical protein SSOG_05556 [Streptomyces himastatinicus ATCC 53653]